MGELPKSSSAAPKSASDPNSGSNTSHALQMLLTDIAARAARYIQASEQRHVAPLDGDVERLESLGGPLPQTPSSPADVISLLDEFGSPATIASTGGRYFGFVTGGALPAALAADWMASAWDQNAYHSPLIEKIEQITFTWMCQIFGLPESCAAGFVTGTTMATFTGLAAARHALLQRAGWNVEEDGLFNAPPITVVIGSEVHASLLKALSLLGLGRKRVKVVPTDNQGRMRADALPVLNDRTIVCIQSGNVNTGSFDPAAEICARAREANAWVHVDGAFGLWAAAVPSRAHLVEGIGAADSWAVDCHKWLNVPYDSGVIFVREPEHLHAAMTVGAPYLKTADGHMPPLYTPENSRRARAVAAWAALRSLGRNGLAELIERNCQLAKRFAEGIRAAGYTVLNDVVLNQVLVAFGDAATTRRVISALQEDGTAWFGGTQWQGHTAMRISVSSWKTTEEDVDRALAAILRVAQAESSQEAALGQR
ncbi:MAG TPA: aminotransferase class V-fold PLP-dependent enzyme [Candidatus Angelobacter sp.]|nr:aminotransferase class V-fold PLP-dependent enzyme [Candidatus Angelobacter sp.]